MTDALACVVATSQGLTANGTARKVASLAARLVFDVSAARALLLGFPAVALHRQLLGALLARSWVTGLLAPVPLAIERPVTEFAAAAAGVGLAAPSAIFLVSAPTVLHGTRR
jgi:hypothetical protein